MDSKDEQLAFSLNIERLAREKNLCYIDTIIYYCENTGLEMDIAAKMIAGTLKSKIELEAIDLHFLPKPKTRRLPI